MAIEQTYRSIFLEQYIKTQLERGQLVNAASVQTLVDNLLLDKDLSVPQFLAETYHVSSGGEASASSFNQTFSTIREDLIALRRELMRLASVSGQAFERWKIETESIEKTIIDLDERIDNLLLLKSGTEGYHSIIFDNFTDTFNVDLSLSTAHIDLQSSTVQLGSSSDSFSRIFLNNLTTNDVNFKVRTTIGFKGRADSLGTVLDPFKQFSNSWYTSIIMRNPRPVTCELAVKLGTDAVSLSKIFLSLHDSSGVVSITPLYSVDNRTYYQLPTNNFTLTSASTATFSFDEISAKWIKFILIKEAPDIVEGQDSHIYQLGFKDIMFFNESFSVTGPGDTHQKIISQPRYQLGADKLALGFERLTLETCEKLDEDTEIDYYITTSNDPDVPIDSNTLWIPISPINRATARHPQILVVGDANETSIGDDETLQISYDASVFSTDPDLVDPAGSFQLLSVDSNDSLVDETITIDPAGERVRYRSTNSGEKILNYQIKLDQTTSGSGTGSGFEINESSIQLFRNVGTQGLTDQPSDQVRGIQRGWRFEDPYYVCVIQILNPEGLSIDVGDKAIIIDDISYKNEIDGSILTGKSLTRTGIHSIKVHKTSWLHVTSGLNSLAELQAADTLYPYNHKLLVEGYSYGTSFPEEDQIYIGADLFAEIYAQKVSIFDMINNVEDDNFSVFALDTDAPDIHTGGNNPTTVFVVKVNEEDTDFVNENFVLRFTRINQLQSYLRFRADLKTEDATRSPVLHGYKIKLG